MNLQGKYKFTKDSTINQNYINFIKKNQLFIHDHINSKLYQKQSTINYPSPYRPQPQQNNLHSSLSKFHFASIHLDQVSKIYHIGKTNEQPINLSQKQVPINPRQTRQRQSKYEGVKQQVEYSYKNKSVQNNRGSVRDQLNRYKNNEQIDEKGSLKFPFIEKNILIAINAINQTNNSSSIQKFNEELKNQIRLNNSKNQTKQSKQTLSREHQKKREEIKQLQKIRMRQELYGLLPVFRIPNEYKTKNPPLQRKSNKLITLDDQQQKTPIKTVSKRQKDSITLVSDSKFIAQPLLQKQQQLELLQKQESTKQALQTIEKEFKLKPKKKISNKKEEQLSMYQIKLRSYRQFLFMINLAHRIFDPLILRPQNTFKSEHKYKYSLGIGNNYLLVKSLLKRRFWWDLQNDSKKAHFSWTQLKIDSFYQQQRKTQIQDKHYKLDADFIPKQSPKKKTIKVSQPKTGIFKAPLPPNDKKIFTNSDKHYYDQYLTKIEQNEKAVLIENRLKLFDQNLLKARTYESSLEKMHNHFQHNYFIGNKKALFYNLKQFYDLQKKNVFEVIPLTYHIKTGMSDPNYENFINEYKRLKDIKGSKNIWIVKPGELSNRGQGITVIDEIYELNTIIKKKEKHSNGKEKTYIVQKYIERPLLYRGRKFDIRHYMMISKMHGIMRAYWFGEGYIRTSSQQFKISEIGESIIHLTNDAIQKYSEGYGKYEQGNKLSYHQFQRYMDSSFPQEKFNFSEMIYPKMKAIALDAVKATYLQLDPNNYQHNFQIFGLDFMIDCNYNVWLIEVNTNPCLELSSKLLARIIPTMLEQSLRLTLDVIFPPPTHYPNSHKYLVPDNPLERLQFQLIFDQNRDGKQLQQLYAGVDRIDMGQVDEQDETYQNDGKQIDLNKQIE